MGNKLQELMIQGLTLAMADAEGKPLHGARSTPGLFPSTVAGKQAAHECIAANYLKVVGVETRGKSAIDLYGITETGTAFLLSRVSPRPVLEELVRVVESRGRQVEQVVAAARECQATFAALQGHVAKTLAQLQAQPAPVPYSGDSTWKQDILRYLKDWQSSRPNEDCPLPDLFAHARQVLPGLTLGQFHDGLRRLHDDGQVYLHPWTGPLYEIPDPACALLIGHAVAFYASRRDDDPRQSPT